MNAGPRSEIEACTGIEPVSESPASGQLFFHNRTPISTDWEVRWRDTTLASLARQPDGPVPLDNDALIRTRGCVGRNRTRAVFEFHRELTTRK